MAETTTITLAQIDAAITRVLINGEKWKMDEVESELGLKELRALREEIISGQNGISFSGVSFQNAGSES